MHWRSVLCSASHPACRSSSSVTRRFYDLHYCRKYFFSPVLLSTLILSWLPRDSQRESLKLENMCDRLMWGFDGRLQAIALRGLGVWNLLRRIWILDDFVVSLSILCSRACNKLVGGFTWLEDFVFLQHVGSWISWKMCSTSHILGWCGVDRLWC
jgi:hypothetical protein